MQLYSFFNSSASYRVRIALALKGLSYTYHGVNLRTGQQRQPRYLEYSPGGIVPTLIDGDVTLTQSLIIIDYLDRRYPQHPLIPFDDASRLRALEIAQTIACDIHPINNLRVLHYLTNELNIDQQAKQRWYEHWIREGLHAVETLLTRVNSNGRYCVGDTPTIADCCLIPQIANAERMSCDLRAYPLAMSIYGYCTQLPAFQAAAPAHQPDFQA